MTLTSHPKTLIVSEQVSVEDAPLRIVFLGSSDKTWETSAVERIDLMSLELRFAEIKHHRWMLNIQGHVPMPGKPTDEAILPRLKFGIKFHGSNRELRVRESLVINDRHVAIGFVFSHRRVIGRRIIPLHG